MKNRIRKVGFKNVRFFLEDAGIFRIILPKGASVSDIEDYLLKPGKFEFGLIKNDNSIPKIFFEIDKALAPKSRPKIDADDVKIVFLSDKKFTNLFVTYFLLPNRKSKPVQEKYKDDEFPMGYYYFSIYDRMMDRFRDMLSKEKVNELIPNDIRLLFTSYPKEYYSEQTQDTYKIYDFYLIEKESTISGEFIEDAYFSYTPEKEPAVFIKLNETGAKKLEKISAENIGRNLAMILDNKIYDSPIVQQKIVNGKVMLKNIKSKREGEFLELILKSGTLNLPVYRYEIEEE